jgi:phage FluMu protein Com
MTTINTANIANDSSIDDIIIHGNKSNKDNDNNKQEEEDNDDNEDDDDNNNKPRQQQQQLANNSIRKIYHNTGCFGCGGDHYKINCPYKNIPCSSCGVLGHVPGKCKKERDTSCWTCGLEGHNAIDCPTQGTNNPTTHRPYQRPHHNNSSSSNNNNAPDTSNTSKSCFICGGPHVRAHCPNRFINSAHSTTTTTANNNNPTNNNNNNIRGGRPPIIVPRKNNTLPHQQHHQQQPIIIHSCFGCGGNHIRQACPYKFIPCATCGINGHVPAMCRRGFVIQQQQQQQQQHHHHPSTSHISMEKSCYICGQIGHLKNHCPRNKVINNTSPPSSTEVILTTNRSNNSNAENKKKSTSTTSREAFCYVCGSDTHLGANCPNA